MYDWGKEQEKEIATIKERTIYLNLSDADCKRISTYAAKANITVSQLLESFIGDLVNGTYTNGSDEGDCAQEWFERCGYGMNSEKTFLRYILEEGDDVEFLLNGLENVKKSKELIQTLKEDLQKEIDRQRENPEYQYEWEEEDKECIQTEQEELVCKKKLTVSEKILNINTNGKKRIKNVFKRSRKNWMQQFSL